jgi:hypothetical protein
LIYVTFWLGQKRRQTLTLPYRILAVALLAIIAVGIGCSSNPVQAHRVADGQAQQVRQQKVAEAPRQDFRTAFNPEQEAAKIGVQLYPDAKAYTNGYSIRTGNSYMQHAFFVTPDSKEKMAEFYTSAYHADFRPNDKGRLAAFVDGENTKDFYIFEIIAHRDGNTTLHVTRIHSCDTYSYREPCDTTPYEPHAGRRSMP